MQRFVTTQEEIELTNDEMKALKDRYLPWRIPAYIDIEIMRHIDDHWTLSYGYGWVTK